MDFENYLMAETNCFTKENGSIFECKLNDSFDFIPLELDLDPDPWEENLETSIEKVTEIEKGVFQYDFVIEDINIDEDDYDEEDEDAPEKYQRFSLTLKAGDKIEIMRFFEADEQDFTYITLLAEITEVSKEKFAYKVIGIFEDDAEEEDYTYIPMEYKVGDNLEVVPREAVYPAEITLTEIKKSGDDFVMTIFVKADDDEEDEDQTLSFTVRKGSRLEFDEFEMGIVCFVRPDRNPIDVEVLEVSEKGITLRKC